MNHRLILSLIFILYVKLSYCQIDKDTTIINVSVRPTHLDLLPLKT